MLLTFKGGVDAGNKSEFLSGSVINTIPSGETLSIPIPSGCTPVLAAGDGVLAGQVIAVSDSELGASVSSPVSGTVIKVSSSRITVENDFQDTPCKELEAEDVITFLRDGGVTDRFGLPAAQKIANAPALYIINCVEDQPYMVNVQAILSCRFKEFIGGIKLLEEISENAHIVICTTPDLAEYARNLSEALMDDERVQFLTVSGKYPQSWPHILKRTATTEQSCEVIGTEELYNIYRVLTTKRPITDKLVTLSGDCTRRAEVFSVPYGTSVSTLIKSGTSFKREPLKVVKGSVMNGDAIYNLRSPIDRTVSSVLTLFDHQHRYAGESHCISCGRCDTVCPEGLSPKSIIKAYKFNDTAALERLCVSKCTLCGCCSFICPSRVNLPLILRSAQLMGE